MLTFLIHSPPSLHSTCPSSHDPCIHGYEIVEEGDLDVDTEILYSKLDGVSVKVVDRADVSEFVEVGAVCVEVEIWMKEDEDTGIGVVFVDKSVSDVELVDAKVDDSVLDSIEFLGNVFTEANVVDLGTQRGASSNRDFVVVSRSASACIEEFSFSPAPGCNIAFKSAPVSSGLDPPVVSNSGGFCE